MSKKDNPLLSRELLDRLLEKPAFSYNAEADPVYRQYRELYETEGRKAAENVFGLASANTGGYANSYAASVAASAYDDMMEKLSQKAAQLESEAYKRSGEETESQLKLISALSDAEDREYERGREEEETRKKDAYDRAAYGDFSELENMGVDVSTARKRDLLEIAKIYAEYGDYSLLRKLGIDVSSKQELDRLERNLLNARIMNYYY